MDFHMTLNEPYILYILYIYKFFLNVTCIYTCFVMLYCSSSSCCNLFCITLFRFEDTFWCSSVPGMRTFPPLTNEGFFVNEDGRIPDQSTTDIVSTLM